LTYTQVLGAQSGTVSYRYPLGTNHNLATVGRVSGALEIEGNKPLRNIYSPSHAVDVRPTQGGQRARVSFETPGGRRAISRTSNSSTRSPAKTSGLSLLTHREPGKDGYFPPDDLAEGQLG
jgi:hypothetical protein